MSVFFERLAADATKTMVKTTKTANKLNTKTRFPSASATRLAVNHPNMVKSFMAVTPLTEVTNAMGDCEEALRTHRWPNTVTNVIDTTPEGHQKP